MRNGNGRSPLDITTFNKLSRLYILALSAIALSIIFSQFLVQGHLNNQLSDSRVINVAGRQRMLSQKISKELLLLYGGPVNQDSLTRELEKTLELWTASHRGLQHGSDSLELPAGNSDRIQQMFGIINPHHEAIVRSTEQILDSIQQTGRISTDWLGSLRDTVLANEAKFLQGMDSIVFQYDAEARTKLQTLKRTELILLAVALLILLLEILFFFRPAAIYVRNNIRQLIGAEQEARDMTSEIEELYKTREQSMQELRALNFAMDQTALFASAKTSGQIVYMSDKFRKLLGLSENQLRGTLPELMSTQEGEQQYIQELISAARSGIRTAEVRLTNREGEKIWLDMSIVPVNRSGVKQDMLILCSDITSRKIAQQKLERMTKERFDQEIQQQKLRSVQVIEAQEEERKRIARDMHDGIGQMLTALKFNLEAVSLKNLDRAKTKLEELKGLTTKLIKGVRIATFNLTPPELSDYGIATGLGKLASELSKLTGQNILFENRTDFSGRFNSIVETNLYRITQEAVNNAIKYARSDYILITLTHSPSLLSIVIDDNGQGFDQEDLQQQTPDDGSGMGLAFMQERIRYINGRLFIRSRPGEGTRITINIPMKNGELI
ncbi:sensor histidine kinase [Flavilitoribacter nigricans]|uniref:Oxygen sensor histidine kinase NreB n=1 Tax=Flavilitoribacter nigricans (strain ATCC 23147 / DSM 23189 / NBRC 102662 / NCIMB 1420 / SS-2) TaxID=1122177 RepID=A0A2D0N7M5_FLAN2|nr:ATP-binding protein [Flavilitoribacter nigricans]PHN03763.1 histidine kinase [Flavilitoribacter nigricans DSM 23189 = NBRC 102662]